VDTNDGPWIENVDGEPLWREPMIDELCNGIGDNAVRSKARSPTRQSSSVDAVVLLTRAVDILLDRLQRRTIIRLASDQTSASRSSLTFTLWRQN